jgi:hypothetical protein
MKLNMGILANMVQDLRKEIEDIKNKKLDHDQIELKLQINEKGQLNDPVVDKISSILIESVNDKELRTVKN